MPLLDAELAPLVTAALDEDRASINQELVTDVAPVDREPPRRALARRSTWLANVYPLRTDEGETVGAGVVIADLTNERQREAQYRQAQRLESIGRLTGGIAHDFNNILTVIVGFGEMAARGVQESLEEGQPVDPHVIDSLEQVQLAADRASALTRQLLAYGRQQVLHPESLAIAGVVQEVDAMLRRVIGEDVTLVTRISDALWPVRADRSQVEQILMNLAVNARDAMPDGGQLVIEGRNVELDDAYARQHVGTSAGAHVLLAISDTGVGMDPATAARAFEPWFTTKEPGRGTGLGLATVYGIVKQSGGSIELYSEVGHGTTFKIYLPRDVGAPPLAADLPAARPAPAPGRSARILLVEDDAAVALLAREVLAADGHRVEVARTGREALQLFDAGAPFDLVITDMVMPELGGRALADELRRRGASPKLIFMSGYAAEAVSQRTVLPPDAVFVEKPFRGTELQDIVRRQLDLRIDEPPARNNRCAAAYDERPLPSFASRLYGPAPQAAKSNQMSEYSITVSPRLAHHQIEPLPPEWIQKYATAISPDAMNATQRVPNPSTSRAPPTSSIVPATPKRLISSTVPPFGPKPPEPPQHLLRAVGEEGEAGDDSEKRLGEGDEAFAERSTHEVPPTRWTVCQGISGISRPVTRDAQRPQGDLDQWWRACSIE